LINVFAQTGKSGQLKYMEKINYQDQEIRRWDVGPSTFLASPEQGALLMNWHLNMGDGSVRDVIHWPESLGDTGIRNVHGGIPILFPFAGRCFLDGEQDKWSPSSGASVNMPMHGFAKDADFSVRSIDQSGFEAELIQKDNEYYPHDYTFTVIYHFLELSLQISLVLENEGRTPIPWSAGLHPYFQVPWRKDLALSDHTLKIPAKTVYQYEPEGNLTKKAPSTDGSYRLDAPDLVNNIFNQTTEPSAEISLGNGEETIRISEVGGAQVGSRLTFVTWTKPESPYYCVEPWMSPPNSPANETTRLVAPSARDEFTIEIELA
jgi:galactose mutarotase-like enzyme